MKTTNLFSIFAFLLISPIAQAQIARDDGWNDDWTCSAKNPNGSGNIYLEIEVNFDNSADRVRVYQLPKHLRPGQEASIPLTKKGTIRDRSILYTDKQTDGRLFTLLIDFNHKLRVGSYLGWADARLRAAGFTNLRFECERALNM